MTLIDLCHHYLANNPHINAEAFIERICIMCENTDSPNEWASIIEHYLKYEQTT